MTEINSGYEVFLMPSNARCYPGLGNIKTCIIIAERLLYLLTQSVLAVIRVMPCDELFYYVITLMSIGAN